MMMFPCYKSCLPWSFMVSSQLRLWPIWVVWDAIQLLLCRAPELQTLNFELTHRCRAQCSGPDKRLKPLDVPECMSSHLTTIHYKGFSEYEMELVEQILKEANVLKDNENHCWKWSRLKVEASYSQEDNEVPKGLSKLSNCIWLRILPFLLSLSQLFRSSSFMGMPIVPCICHLKL